MHSQRLLGAKTPLRPKEVTHPWGHFRKAGQRPGALMVAPPATAGKGCRHPMYVDQPQEKVQGCQEIPRKDECWYQPEKQELVRNSKGLRGEEQRGKSAREIPLLPSEIHPHRHHQEERRNSERLGRSYLTKQSRNTKLAMNLPTPPLPALPSRTPRLWPLRVGPREVACQAARTRGEALRGHEEQSLPSGRGIGSPEAAAVLVLSAIRPRNLVGDGAPGWLSH